MFDWHVLLGLLVLVLIIALLAAFSGKWRSYSLGNTVKHRRSAA